MKPEFSPQPEPQAPAPGNRQADDEPRRKSDIPYLRAWKIGTRTLHLIVTYLLFAGHVLGTASVQLEPVLWLAILSGLAMAFLEVYPNPQLLLQGWSLLVLLKVILLALVPLFWYHRIWILLAVVAIAAIGSHLPARYRHYSLLHGRVIKPM